MRSTMRFLSAGSALLFLPVGVLTAAPALAECTQAGGAYVCAQGEVRGGGPTPPTAGPYYPGYCADPWYCSDDWGIDIDLDPGWGRPGGIGPRR